MIHLTCTNCKTVLAIDDAFAGGVCRCKHCGTIQTVPKQSKRPATPSSGEAAETSPKALFTRPATQEIPGGTGLDDLAQVVASSGLSGTGLQSGRLRQSPQPARARHSDPRLMIGGAAAAAIVVVGLLTWLLLRGGPAGTGPAAKGEVGNTENTSGQGSPRGGGGLSAAPATVAPDSREPNFLGVRLHGPKVVYLLDRGNGTKATFQEMLEAAFRSVRTLGPSTRFQMLFWQTDGILAYPPDGMQAATPENAEACRAAIREEVYAFGSSDLIPALERALENQPDEAVIATGKYGLDDEFVKAVLDAHKKSPGTRLHTFSLGAGSPKPLAKVAAATGGVFLNVENTGLLRQFAE